MGGPNSKIDPPKLDPQGLNTRGTQSVQNTTYQPNITHNREHLTSNIHPPLEHKNLEQFSHGTNTLATQSR